MKVGIIRFPNKKDKGKPIFNLTRILSQLATQVYVISGDNTLEYVHEGNNIEVYKSNHYSFDNSIFQIISFIFTQIRLAFGMLKKREINTYIFLGGSLIIPVIFGKFLGKKIILQTMAPSDRWKYKTERPFYKLQELLQEFRFILSDKILFYSPALVDDTTRKNHNKKIDIAYHHHIDLDIFNIEKPYMERNNLVGYIGRFSHQKNFMNFVKSIPIIINANPNIKFLIGGSGRGLEGEMIDYIEGKNLSEKINYKGWIPHKEVPTYLNDLKLLVIPSYSEGLPNILLESMACGTPVLVSNVGAVGDVIRDGENGFILNDKSSETIAKRVIEIINNQDTKNISINAHKTIKNNYNFKNTLQKYRKVLRKINEA